LSGISFITPKHDIPVGPGPRSAAGSLIAYVLESPHRSACVRSCSSSVSHIPNASRRPTSTSIFCYNPAAEVIDYVRKKYGEKSVAQIITFGTLGGNGHPRCRTRHGPSYGEADRLTKMNSFDPKMTLEKALKEAPYSNAPMTRKTSPLVIDSAMKLVRSRAMAGFHAAASSLSDHDLTDYVPLTKERPRRHRHPVLDGPAR